MTWQWNSVRRQDRPEFMVITGRYEAGLLVSIVVILASALLPPEPRLVPPASMGHRALRVGLCHSLKCLPCLWVGHVMQKGDGSFPQNAAPDGTRHGRRGEGGIHQGRDSPEAGSRPPRRGRDVRAARIAATGPVVKY